MVQHYPDIKAQLGVVALPRAGNLPSAGIITTRAIGVNLKSDKPPWYGRGFRQVRADILARQWGHWVDESNHEQGFVLHPEALASFRAFGEDGPPTTPQPG